VVVLLKVVGIILPIVLFTKPTTISKNYTDNLSHLMILAIIIYMILTTAGLISSYIFNLVSGTTVIMVLASAFTISYYLKD
jgi:zinc transport system permease protein